MAYQGNRDIEVRFKREDTFGTKPSVVTGAQVLRLNRGGLNLNKTPIDNPENRRDLQKTRGRHGSKIGDGEFEVSGSVSSFDTLIESVFRNSFTAALDLTTLSLGNATVSSNVISFANPGLLASSVKVGDVVRFPTGINAADLNKDIPILALTDNSITSGVALTNNSATAFTGSRLKKLIVGKLKHSYTFEEYESEIDASEVFKGVRIVGMRVELLPNNMLKITFRSQFQDMETFNADGASPGTAPFYDSPTITTTLGLTAVEAKIILGTETVVDLTTLTLDWDWNAEGEEVIGSDITPDIWYNQASLSGNVGILRKDMVNVTRFLNETPLDLSLRFKEKEADPADLMGFYIPQFTFATSTKSEIGTDGPRIATHDIMCGVDERGLAAGFDPTTWKYFSTAA